MRLRAYFDGAAGHPRHKTPSTYGYLVKDEQDNVLIEAFGNVDSGPGMTSSVGEYEGLIHAMLFLVEHHADAIVTFYGDSEVIIAQMNRQAVAKKGQYLSCYQKAMEIATPFIASGLWHFQWISRAMNWEADKLAKAQRFTQ